MRRVTKVFSDQYAPVPRDDKPGPKAGPVLPLCYPNAKKGQAHQPNPLFFGINLLAGLVGERGFEPPAPASRKGPMLVKLS